MADAEHSSLAYADHERELITGEAVALDLRPAGFMLRAAGAAIDFLFAVLLYLGLALLFFSPLFVQLLDDASAAAVGIALLVLCIVVLPITIETASRGRSLGKLAIGARIVRDDGGAIGFRHAFIRGLVGVIEVFMSLGGIAAITAMLNGRSKRLGDLLAGTYSQYERVAKLPQPVLPVPAELIDWARLADVGRMPDALSRRISQFLAQADKLTPATRTRLARELANEASPHVSPVPQTHPETFLIAVSAVRREREFAALEGERRRLELLSPVLSGTRRGFPPR
jgi:uncharacterized RDD family membrane protein YckC